VAVWWRRAALCSPDVFIKVAGGVDVLVVPHASVVVHAIIKGVVEIVGVGALARPARQAPSARSE
jgi:hypothetical protein